MKDDKSDYQRNKERIRNLAIDYSCHSGEFEWIESEGISYGGLGIIQDYFERNGKRYGLLTEFRNEGII